MNYVLAVLITLNIIGLVVVAGTIAQLNETFRKFKDTTEELDKVGKRAREALDRQQRRQQS